MKKVLAAAIVVLTGAWTSPASIITQWTFETSPPSTSGPHVAESSLNASTSLATGFHATTTSTTYSSPDGAGSDNSFSSKNWAVEDYYQFTTSTLGYDGVSLGFEAASSGTGPKSFRLAYSTDGTAFSDFTTYSVLANASPNPTWNNSMPADNIASYAFAFDLSAIRALNNQSTIYLRLIDSSTASAGGGTVAGSGTSRVDDFTISANAMVGVVPEPSTFITGALLGLPLAMQGLRRLRRQQRL